MGKRLEVCWPYRGEDGETVKIWASETIVRVADGLTDKRSPRAQKIHPAGALLFVGVGRGSHVRGVGWGEVASVAARKVEQAGCLCLALRSL